MTNIRGTRLPTSIVEVLDQNAATAWVEDGAVKAALRKQLCQLCYHDSRDGRCLDDGCFGELRFPGCQPVSMDTDNLRELVDRPGGYYVCEKTDGFRALLYVGDVPNTLHLVDREWNVLRFDLASPCLSGAGTRVVLGQIKTPGYTGRRGAVQPHDAKSGTKLLDPASGAFGVRYRVLLDGDGEKVVCAPAGKARPIAGSGSAIGVAQLALPSGRGFHRRTVIDGEIVVDTIVTTLPDGSTTSRRALRFYAFDLLALGGVNTMDTSLAKRMQLLESAIIAPLRAAEASAAATTAAATAATPGTASAAPGGGAPTTPSPTLPFELLLKDMYEAQRDVASEAHCSVTHVWRNVVPRLPHECDGLIFTPIEQRYLPGKSDLTLLKWKPEQSIDFILGNEGVQRVVDFSSSSEDMEVDAAATGTEGTCWPLYVFHQGIMVAKPRAYLVVDEMNRKELSRCSAGTVVECVWKQGTPSVGLHIDGATRRSSLRVDGAKSGGWAFLKVRDDKETPNALWVVERVEKSIANNIEIGTIAARLAGRVEKSATVNEVLAWEGSGNAGGVDCYAVSARYGALNAAGWAKPPVRPKLSQW